MSGNARIIGRADIEVNAARAFRTTFVGRFLGVMALVVVVQACSASSRAEHLLDEADGLVRDGDLGAALELYERIERDYPSTPAARRARAQATLYRGLERAVALDPMRRARETMVSTARAVEAHRGASGAYPTSLRDLVPARLRGVPVDPWQRPLEYRVRPGRRGYRLACYGADGFPGGAGDDADLVVENGRFVREPAEVRP